MTAVAHELSEPLSPMVAAALGIEAEPLRVPPLELWPAEGDAEAAGGMVAFAEEAKLWAATGCLVPAARQVIERGGTDVSVGFVVCGGNVTQRDVRGWFDCLL